MVVAITSDTVVVDVVTMLVVGKFNFKACHGQFVVFIFENLLIAPFSVLITQKYSLIKWCPCKTGSGRLCHDLEAYCLHILGA